MIRVAWWMLLGLAASAGFNEVCAHIRFVARSDVLQACGWYTALFGLMAYAACGKFGRTWADLVPLRPVSPRLIAPVLAITVGAFVLSFPVLEIWRRIVQAFSEDPDVPQSLTISTHFISIALLPAIFEEAASRGIIVQGLLANAMSERRAIVLSALIFAAVHRSLEGFPWYFLLGVMLAWMFVRTGSLLPGMLMHAVNNAIAMSLSQPDPLATPLSEWFGSDGRTLQSPLVLFVGAALLVMGLIAFRRVLAGVVLLPEKRQQTRQVLARAA